MSLIDRAATFRGNIVDHAVSVTKNEFPQFVCSLIATEIYDEEDGVWVDWTDVVENEITGYFVLYGRDGETLTLTQIKKTLGWDGASFQVLNDGDYSEVGVQFRVAVNTYEAAKSPFKVEWIDEFDATPGRSVKKLDVNELKQLDAKYSRFLKAGAAKPASTKPKTKPTVKAKTAKPTSPKGPVKKAAKKTAPPIPMPASATIPANAPESATPDIPVGHCTKQECWDEIVELRDPAVDDNKLNTSYLNNIKEIAGTNKIEDVTDEQWFLIKEATLSEVALF